MARPKKNSPKRRHKESSTRPKPAVVWIAPNLERITKGEQGRRGLTDPTSGYYLGLADLVLKPPSGAANTIQPSADEALFAAPFPEPHRDESAADAKHSKILRRKSRKGLSHPKPPKVDMPRQSSPEHPKLALPHLRPPKPPKFKPPQLANSLRKPKPPRGRG